MKLLFGRKDVDPDRPDGDGRTPLGWAAIEGHEGVVKPLQARMSIESLDAQRLREL